MTFEFNGPQLKISENRVIEFDYPIHEVISKDDILVVILDIPPNVSMTENVFGVGKDGQIIWQIEKIADTSTNPVNRYTSLSIESGNKISLYNWNGTGVIIDPNTGKITNKWLSR